MFELTEEHNKKIAEATAPRFEREEAPLSAAL